MLTLMQFIALSLCLLSAAFTVGEKYIDICEVLFLCLHVKLKSKKQITYRGSRQKSCKAQVQMSPHGSSVQPPHHTPTLADEANKQHYTLA